MNKRVLVMILTMMVCIAGIMEWTTNVYAEVTSESISFSELMTEDALIGYSQNQTRGVYYSDGHSIINKISSTKVGAGGVTNANVRCTVRVTAILERKNSSGNWERVTSWSKTNQNALSAIVSQSITVASNYYYRVRCNHYAGTDSSSSFTNGLWIGN